MGLVYVPILFAIKKSSKCSEIYHIWWTLWEMKNRFFFQNPSRFWVKCQILRDVYRGDVWQALINETHKTSWNWDILGETPTKTDKKIMWMYVYTWLECSSILYVGALSLWPSDRLWDQISKDSKKSNVGWFFRGGFWGERKETMGKPWKCWRGSVSLWDGICFKKISEG